MIDNLFPYDIGAFVARQETIMKLRTSGLIWQPTMKGAALLPVA